MMLRFLHSSSLPSKLLRISPTGPGSTGRSTLAARLAEHYGTAYAPEFAHDYPATAGPNYMPDDLATVAWGQLAAAARTSRVVFFDTDLLVMKIWFGHAFGSCPEWLVSQLARQQSGLVLFMGVDLPWQPDSLREHPHPQLHGRYLRDLRALNANFAEISGHGAQRFVRACRLVNELLSPTPALLTLSE